MYGLAYKGAMAIEKNRIKKEKELAKQHRQQECQLKLQQKEQERRERERAKERAKREEISHKQEALEYICKELEEEFGEINVNKIKASESYAKKMLNYGLKNSRSFVNMATKVVEQAPDYKNCETLVFAVKSYLNNIETNTSKFNTFIKSNIVSNYEYKIVVLILEKLQQEMESAVK